MARAVDGFRVSYSCRARTEPGDAQEVVGGRYQVGMHLNSLTSTIASFAQTADGLHPAERFLDPFANPLTDSVTAMAHGARIERRTAGTGQVTCHMRGDIERAARANEVSRVVALVPAQGDAAPAGQALSAIASAARRSACRRPARPESRSRCRCDSPSARSPSNRAWPLCRHPSWPASPRGRSSTDGSRSRAARHESPRSDCRDHRAVRAVTSSLGRRLLSDAHASIKSPVHRKVLIAGQLKLHAPARPPCGKTRPPRHAGASRIRLRLKVEWSKLGSSKFRSRNQRNNRL